MLKIFVDSDVIIDFFSDCDPFANAASTLFELNELGKIKVHISAVSINNVYYILRKYLGHKQAIIVVGELLQITEVIATSKLEIKQALANKFKDFEDSIQYSTALTINGIDAIITRNVKDYSNSEIAIFSAENIIKSRLIDKNK